MSETTTSAAASAAPQDTVQPAASGLPGGPAATPLPPESFPPIPEAVGVARVEDVEESLRDVVDPELGINVVDLGLIYGLTVDDTTNIATIDMTLTSAACPLTDVIEDQIRTALAGLVTDFRLNWVWMPPWSVEKITDDGREQLRSLGFNL